MVKRTPLLLTLGFFLLIAGGVTLYQYLISREETSVWDLIPGQTVLVYEADECKECEQKKVPITDILENLQLDFPDSTRKTLEILTTIKKGKAISLHVISKDDFDLVYYFSSAHGKEFESILNSWKGIQVKKYTERELNGTKIHEFTIHGKVFSCVQLDKIWVASFTPFLIEDVIRAFSSDEESIFINDIKAVSSLPRISGDPGNFYVHIPNLINWLGIFPEKKIPMLSIGQASLLDIKYDVNSFTLNGLSLVKDNEKSTLSFFENQTPVQFTLKQYISNQTILATTFGISDGTTFYKNLNLSKNASLRDSISNLATIDFEKLFSSFGNELSVSYQEAKGSSLSKILLFETSKPHEWLNAFDHLSRVAEKEDTIFYEKYSTYEIREIEINDLTGKLFSPLISGFSQTYYTSIGNTIILSEELEQIKQFVDDIDQENVWGKSIAFNRFLETTLLESTLSVYINTPLVWSVLSNRLNPRWKQFISQNSSILNSFDLGAIQFSHLNESFYTNITWMYSDNQAIVDKLIKKADRLVASMPSPINSKPFIVRSHVSKEDEVLLQDSLFMLHHVSNEGKVLWSVGLDGPILDEIKQVDFFNNGKLQFFFATSKKIHIIDRLGNYVAPFPTEIKVKDIEFVSVVDYDNSKKYRFLLADKSGKLWMYDKDIQNLEGWKPKNVNNELFTAAQHHRIRGKDYILAIRKDGWAHLMNRRGEDIKGFPLNLDARLEGDYFLERGNSAATTIFVCVSKEGFRIKFNLEGKILSRETLIKPFFETQFSLITEQSGKSYVIRRQDAKRLSILNEDAVEFISNDFVGTNPVRIQYYDFGAGRIFISITDTVQDVSFIYDGKGALLTQTPIEGKFIELRPSKSEFPKTFVVDQRSLIIQ